VAVVDLKLSEKVLFIISLVHETMETGAITSIFVQNIHGDHIFLSWFHEFLIQLDSVAIECKFWVRCLTVYDQTLDLRTKKIEEKSLGVVVVALLWATHFERNVSFTEILVTRQDC